MNGAQIDSMRTGPTYERNASVMFVDRIRRSPERTALVVLGEDEISYEALGERLAATVHALRAAGVEQGDRVETGRASCRERGWPDVSIAVGAGSLKEKT